MPSTKQNSDLAFEGEVFGLMFSDAGYRGKRVFSMGFRVAEDVLALKISTETVFEHFKLWLFNRAIDLAPPNLFLAGRLTHKELVFWQSSGVMAGANHERPRWLSVTLTAPDGFFVKRG